MEAFTYKGIADGKYVEGDIEAINQEEASHKLKEQKIIITNLIRSKKKKGETKAKAKGKGFSFGKPHFIHYVHDKRMYQEIDASKDVVVFSKHAKLKPMPIYSYDDSQYC